MYNYLLTWRKRDEDKDRLRRIYFTSFHNLVKKLIVSLYISVIVFLNNLNSYIVLLFSGKLLNLIYHGVLYCCTQSRRYVHPEVMRSEMAVKYDALYPWCHLSTPKSADIKKPPSSVPKRALLSFGPFNPGVRGTVQSAHVPRGISFPFESPGIALDNEWLGYSYFTLSLCR